MSSPIVGTFTSQSLNAKLVVVSADDSTGNFQGTYSQGATSWQITGVWNTSTMQPNAVFRFTGGVAGASVANIISGAGAALDCFNSFAGTTISVSNGTNHGYLSSVSGPFTFVKG
ncbi:MAG: hypothetical protein B7Z37_17810 [Verrucomicrobia bacterium 12-59-8]|nr:MAG: hypothetical protein B7Z37_17810 [Verrucomicrobia bacterium 12-59-8]